MAMELGTGECMDGAPIFWFGNSVVFADPCPPCEKLLRDEGFDVSVQSAVAA